MDDQIKETLISTEVLCGGRWVIILREIRPGIWLSAEGEEIDIHRISAVRTYKIIEHKHLIDIILVES